MNRYPNKELTLSQTVWSALKLHYLTLRQVVFYALLISLTKNIAWSLMRIYANSWVRDLFLVLAIILCISFFAVSLYVAGKSFNDESLTFGAGFKRGLARLPKLFLTIVLYIIGALIVSYFVRFVAYMVFNYVDTSLVVHKSILIIGLVIFLVYVFMLAFALPLVVVDNFKPLKALKSSISLTEKNKFGVLVLFFLGMIIWFLIMPLSIHAQFFAYYHLEILFDFVVLAVMLPLFLNMLLLIFHDSKELLRKDLLI